MSLFLWREQYSVQHPQIDGQHKELFRLASELHAAMMRGEARPIMAKTLDRLIEYTRSHFRAEEGLMTSSAYPQYRAHKAEHDDFTAEVMELQKGLESGKFSVSVDTLHFLRAWLERHIMVSDQRIALYLARKNGRELAGVK